jgi:hypothetical protein
VIEIDVTSPSLDKLPLYAQIGVPEVWRDTGDAVTILALQQQQGTSADAPEYVAAQESLVLPGLFDDALLRFVQTGLTMSDLDWLRSVRDWARNHLASTTRPAQTG